MASPQKENGFVPIANELYEALCRTRINGEARQVLDVIIRKTYGFQKKSDCIALSQFVLYTGMTKIAVRKALNKLITLNLITQKGNDIAKEYAIIKDYSLWKPLPKKVTLPKKVMNRTQKGNEPYPKSAQQKKENNYTKDTAPSAGGLGNEVINLFKEVNPSFKELFKRKPQHSAAERLVELHGYDKMKKIIGFLVLRRSDRFCPNIATPIQLEDKWAALEKYALGLKTESEIKNKPTWKIWT